jgi:hypothetical protein
MISEEQYAEAQAEWDAAGPPAPILSGWLDDLGDWD